MVVQNLIIYKGNVQIYLQGVNALLPAGSITESQIMYHVGSTKSNIIITDYRRDPNFAALRALSGIGGVDFASIFNQPALIEIKGDEDNIQIELYESSEDNVNPMLWLGVINDDEISIHYILWEKFTNIDNSALAFAALLED